MAVMEDELQRLWQLLAELSSQLTQNREQTEQLKKQAEELKTQAIHTGTGYALKRFNVDLSKGKQALQTK
jgi:phage shock protein A